MLPHCHELTFIRIFLLLDKRLSYLLSLPVFSLSLFLALSLPVFPSVLTPRWCPPDRNHTWLTPGDGRGDRDSGSDTDPDAHLQREGGSWPSGFVPLLLCSCVVTVFSFIKTLETTE